MKICYLCADRGIPLNGTKGASAHVRGMARAFARLGHDVLVLAFSGVEPDPDFASLEIPSPLVSKRLPDNGNPPIRRALGHIWNNVAVETALQEAIKNFQPDVIYERYSPFGVAGGLLASQENIRHVLEVNAPLAWEGRRYRKQAFGNAATFLEEAAFSATSRLIAVSQELKTALVKDGVDPGRITVVPNGVDGELFCDQGKSAEIDSHGRMVIGFVGSLKPWHGIGLLADAFRSLAARRSHHLLIVGSGPEANIVHALKDEYPGQVTHIEAVSQVEVAPYLRSMDIAVAPYPSLDHFYYSPLKILEYMATGRPVVASFIGQIKDLIENGKTGVLVPPGDIAALVQAIEVLSEDQEYRRAMGAAAADVVEKKHLWIYRAEEILSAAEVYAS